MGAIAGLYTHLLIKGESSLRVFRYRVFLFPVFSWRVVAPDVSSLHVIYRLPLPHIANLGDRRIVGTATPVLPILHRL